MRSVVARPVDSVVIDVIVIRWGALSSRRFCHVGMNLELGFRTRAGEELNVLGAVGSGMTAAMRIDCCMLLLRRNGQFWKRSMLP